MTKAFIKTVCSKGIHDTRKYRYMTSEDYNRGITTVLRISLDALGTSAAYSLQSDITPNGWQPVATVRCAIVTK